MAANNIPLFNAALAAAYAVAARSGTVAAPAALLTAATDFATEVDAAIAVDASIVSPTTTYGLSRAQLLQSICENALNGGVAQAIGATNYAAIAASIALQYAAAAANFQ